MKTLRCDAVLVQLIATEYDAEGRPVRELTLSPVKVFRAAMPDVWTVADDAIVELQKQQAQP